MAAVVKPSNATFKDKEKPQEVRRSNIVAARGTFELPIRVKFGAWLYVDE